MYHTPWQKQVFNKTFLSAENTEFDTEVWTELSITWDIQFLDPGSLSPTYITSSPCYLCIYSSLLIKVGTLCSTFWELKRSPAPVSFTSLWPSKVWHFLHPALSGWPLILTCNNFWRVESAFTIFYLIVNNNASSYFLKPSGFFRLYASFHEEKQQKKCEGSEVLMHTVTKATSQNKSK